MSDLEEPPVKVTKIDIESKLAADGSIELPVDNGMDLPVENPSSLVAPDEGQEEWLNEENLTDDDFHLTVHDQDTSNIGQTSQEDSTMSFDNTVEPTILNGTTEDASRTINEHDSIFDTVEDALNNMENSQTSIDESQIVHQDDLNETDVMQDELDSFLIRKTNNRTETIAQLKTEDQSSSVKAEKDNADDGNDTDELLRMLGEGDVKKELKKVTVPVKMRPQRASASHDADSTDDDIFQGGKITNIKVAKTALLRKKVPAKAEPEDSDTDMSSDEISMVNRMFRPRKPSAAGKSRASPAAAASQGRSLLKSGASQQIAANTRSNARQQSGISQQIAANLRSNASQQSDVSQKTRQLRGLMSSDRIVTDKPSRPVHQYANKRALRATQPSEPPPTRRPAARTDRDTRIADEKPPAMHSRPKEAQRIMKPEVMDEEVPSDGESEASDDSFYEGLPSSESEDIEDWFALDIRAERAGDYIPLLGHKAFELLTDEKQRVCDKLSQLRTSLSSLNTASQEQLKSIDEARRTLAELDAVMANS